MCYSIDVNLIIAHMTAIKKLIVWILTLESRLILKKYKPFIVAVTGSVGKTSTKDAIYDVLKSPKLCRIDGGICHVRKSEKSFNSEFGLPLTIIGIPTAWRSVPGWIRNIKEGASLIFRKHEYPDCLVLEVGADHPGDIRRAAPWLKPDIAIITRVSKTPVHVEFFDSPEQVFEEKASLAENVKKGGTVILFADDDKVMSIAERVKGREAKIISFGTSSRADVKGANARFTYEGADNREWKIESTMGTDFKFQPTSFHAPIGISFTLESNGQNAEVSVKGILGTVYMYPLLAAAAVGIARELPLVDIANSLNQFHPPKGRMNIIPGQSNSTLIDDTYNSSPDAALAALSALKEVQYATTKIAVLGDMMELGKYSTEEHRTIGREAAAVLGASDKLMTVGPRSRATAEEAVKAGMKTDSVVAFDSSQEAADALLPTLKPGDVILVKGSQSIRMERIVKTLMRDQEKSAELLVRQEKEWLEKK